MYGNPWQVWFSDPAHVLIVVALLAALAIAGYAVALQHKRVVR